MGSHPPSTVTIRGTAVPTTSLAKIIRNHIPHLAPYETLYKHLHSHPELSFLEANTSALAAERLASFSPDFQVTTRIGGYGVAGVLRNGGGQTVLLRADTDGLPVLEKTGVDYASKVTMTDVQGVTHPVMHACGHDMHVASMLAAVELLVSARDSWSGTLVVVFQPAEERGAGARAMVDDGLYTRHGVPVPDVVLGQHVMPYQAGLVGMKRGVMASAADSFKVTVFGRGGHASQPHRTVDPVVVAAGIVLKLQTIVSRECPPDEMAVLTVGSLQAGTTENIIPDTAEIKLDMRTVDPSTSSKMIRSIHRIVYAECRASNCPSDPLIERSREFPLTWNDDVATAPVDQTFREYFGGGGGGGGGGDGDGNDNTNTNTSPGYDGCIERLLGSEDFSILGTSVGRPCCFWVVGMTESELWEEEMVRKKNDKKNDDDDESGGDVPINHSPYFKPAIQPTLTACVEAMALAALTFLAT